MLQRNEKVHKHLIEKKLNIKIPEFCRRWFNNERRLPLSKNQTGKKQKVEMRTSTVTFIKFSHVNFR